MRGKRKGIWLRQFEHIHRKDIDMFKQEHLCAVLLNIKESVILIKNVNLIFLKSQPTHDIVRKTFK